MSQRTQSTAAILRVKGVSFNYLQFLWKRLDTISNVREQGNYPVALKLISELIVWLPPSIKDEFMERALQIQSSLLLIRSNSLPELQEIIDIHQRMAKRNKLLQAYSAASLTDFINKLTNKLDQLGYMENTKTVTEGDADEGGEGTWADRYGEMKDKGKSKKVSPRKDSVPTGSVTD